MDETIKDLFDFFFTFQQIYTMAKVCFVTVVPIENY